MHRSKIFFLALVTAGSLAFAEDSTSKPTTQSTADLASDIANVATSSPKSALKAYNLAMRLGDFAGMLALQHAVTDDELHVARASSQSDLQVAALEQAARDKFGEAGEKQIAAAIGDEDDSAVDAAKETITGSTAQLQFSSDPPVPMIRINDRWAVDVAASIREFNGDADALCDQVIRRGSAAKVTAQEIVAGQFAEAAAAVEALKSRLKES